MVSKTYNKYDQWLEACIVQNNGSNVKVDGDKEGATAYYKHHPTATWLQVGQWRGNNGVVYNVRSDINW